MAKYVGLKIGKVHESHIYSEYYCGGCGYPLTDHDSFCPECGGALHEPTTNSHISILNNDSHFTINENSPKLPTDKLGRTLFVGDTIHILHNNKVGKIISLTHTVHDSWIVFLDIDSGGFLLPQSKYNVVKLVMR